MGFIQCNALFVGWLVRFFGLVCREAPLPFPFRRHVVMFSGKINGYGVDDQSDVQSF